MHHMKPLFIPLRGAHYDRFATGEKTVEYRKAGGRWNERTCFVGRPVILSRGYGKQHRLRGTIVNYRTTYAESNKPAAFIEIFGDGKPCFEIHIEVQHD